MRFSRVFLMSGAVGLGLALLGAACGPDATVGSADPAGTAVSSTSFPATAATAAPPPKPVFKPEAKLSAMAGDVKFSRAGGAPAAVTDGQEFQAGDVFWLAEGATATMALEDDGSATLTGPGVVAMTNNERREWSVVTGTVLFAVKRTVGRDSFQVRTTSGLLRAKGAPPPAGEARFTVAVGEDGATWFGVTTGDVEVIDEAAELKMELDRAAESRTVPPPGTGAPMPPPPSKIVAPTPLQTVAAGNALELSPEGKAGAAAATANADAGPAPEWWTAHAAGTKLGKIVAARAKTAEELVNSSAGLVEKSEKLRASHKDLLEKAKAAREAKDEETARKIKTELVANTREARALGRMAHQAVTVAGLHWLLVDHLKAKAAGDAAVDKATAKLAAGGELATKKLDVEKKVDGLRKRPKFAVPTMPFAHGKLPPGMKGMSMSAGPRPIGVPGAGGTGAYSAAPVGPSGTAMPAASGAPEPGKY